MVSSSQSGKLLYRIRGLHQPSKLALRSVQTVLPCTSPQPSRESKLHEFLKGFFLILFKGAFVKTVLLFKVKNIINLASACNLHCNSGDIL